MPKKKRGKKNKKNFKEAGERRALVEADLDGQVYGFLSKALGSRYFEVKCLDNKTRRCRVRNRRMRVTAGDCCIISVREFDDKNGDIIYRYDSVEINAMKRHGLLPNSELLDDGDDCGITIEEETTFNFEDI